MRKEATLSFAIAFMILFIIIVFIFIAGIPLMLKVNESMHSAERKILDIGSDFANQTGNLTAKQAMVGIFDDTRAMGETSETTLGQFAKYGWLFVVIISAFVVTVLAKRAEMMDKRGGLI